MFEKSPSSKRRSLTAVLLSMLLISALAGTFQKELQAAEGLQTNSTKTQIQTVDSLQAPKEPTESYENGVRIQLTSPRQGARYYDVVPLTATASSISQLAFFNFYYSVDGISYGGERQVSPTFTTKLDLSLGEHRLRIGVDAITRAQADYAESTGILPFGVASGAVEVSFFVEPYPIIFFSLTVDVPQNSSSPQLIFSVSKSVTWAGYSIDGYANVTVPTTTSSSSVWGNAALVGLSPGWHNVTVYATDPAHQNGISENITVKVTESFPTALVAVAVLASAVAVGAGLLLYFKKRKR
jgi:hypothetical protein